MRAGDLNERRRASIVGWKTVLKQTLPRSILCVASLSAALEPLLGASAHFTVDSSAIYRSSLPEMVVLPTGHSRIGDLSCSLPPLFCAAYRHERPVRTVIISRPIAMSKYEVTFEDYDRFALATNRTPPDDAGWGRGTRPVPQVTVAPGQAVAIAICASCAAALGSFFRSICVPRPVFRARPLLKNPLSAFALSRTSLPDTGRVKRRITRVRRARNGAQNAIAMIKRADFSEA